VEPAPPSLAIIAAVAENDAIGEQGRIPWRLPEDLARFKRLTMGHAILMGRRTFEEIRRPLAGRRNLVVSRSLEGVPAGFEVARSLDEGLAMARQADAQPFVIGGAALYAEALPLATRFYLTEVTGRFPAADCFFPSWDREAWVEVARERFPGGWFVDLARRG
jgi:dihydrofolate reductase